MEVKRSESYIRHDEPFVCYIKLCSAKHNHNFYFSAQFNRELFSWGSWSDWSGSADCGEVTLLRQR